MRITSLILTLVFAVSAQAGDLLNLLDKNDRLYAQRFDAAGNDLKNQKYLEDFVANQKEAIEYLKSNGHLTRHFKIHNNKSKMVVSIYMIQEKSGEFVGLYVEKSEYAPGDENTLYIYSKSGLDKGADVVKRGNKTVIRVQSAKLTESSGEVISVLYPKSFNKQQFEKFNFYIKPDESGQLDMFKEDTSLLRALKLKININYLKFDFGIQIIDGTEDQKQQPKEEDDEEELDEEIVA